MARTRKPVERPVEVEVEVEVRKHKLGDAVLRQRCPVCMHFLPPDEYALHTSHGCKAVTIRVRGD